MFGKAAAAAEVMNNNNTAYACLLSEQQKERSINDPPSPPLPLPFPLGCLDGLPCGVLGRNGRNGPCSEMAIHLVWATYLADKFLVSHNLYLYLLLLPCLRTETVWVGAPIRYGLF